MIETCWSDEDYKDFQLDINSYMGFFPEIFHQESDKNAGSNDGIKMSSEMEKEGKQVFFLLFMIEVLLEAGLLPPVVVGLLTKMRENTLKHNVPFETTYTFADRGRADETQIKSMKNKDPGYLPTLEMFRCWPESVRYILIATWKTLLPNFVNDTVREAATSEIKSGKKDRAISLRKARADFYFDELWLYQPDDGESKEGAKVGTSVSWEEAGRDKDSGIKVKVWPDVPNLLLPLFQDQGLKWELNKPQECLERILIKSESLLKQNSDLARRGARGNFTWKERKGIWDTVKRAVKLHMDTVLCPTHFRPECYLMTVQPRVNFKVGSVEQVTKNLDSMRSSTLLPAKNTSPVFSLLYAIHRPVIDEAGALTVQDLYCPMSADCPDGTHHAVSPSVDDSRSLYRELVSH